MSEKSEEKPVKYPKPVIDLRVQTEKEQKSMKTALIQMDKVMNNLEKPMSIQESWKIVAQAEALRQYLKKSSASIDVINESVEIKIKAERICGQFLLKIERLPGKKVKKTSPTECTRFEQVLEELNITKTKAYLFQDLTYISDEKIEEIAQEHNEKGKELTSKYFYNLGKKIKEGNEPKKKDKEKPKKEKNLKSRMKKFKIFATDYTFDDMRKYVTDEDQVTYYYFNIVDFKTLPEQEQFNDIIKLSSHVLKENGRALFLVEGHELFDMKEHIEKLTGLTYWWTSVIITKDLQPVEERRLQTNVKFLLYFVNAGDDREETLKKLNYSVGAIYDPDNPETRSEVLSQKGFSEFLENFVSNGPLETACIPRCDANMAIEILKRGNSFVGFSATKNLCDSIKEDVKEYKYYV